MRTARLALITSAAALAATAAVGISAVGAESDAATDSAPSAVTQLSVLSTMAAQQAAQAAYDQCTSQGYAVTVSVVGRDGALLALVRSQNATTASIDSATGKAYASASFRAPSGTLGENAATNPGLLQMPGFVVLRGGLPISSGGQVIGAIGVGGAPGGQLDEACAKVGIERIAGGL